MIDNNLIARNQRSEKNSLLLLCLLAHKNRRKQYENKKRRHKIKETIVKIGSVELYENEALKLYEQGKYIVTYGGVYQLFYSNAQKQVYGQKVIYTKGIASRGRFYTMTAEAINHILGGKVLLEKTL